MKNKKVYTLKSGGLHSLMAFELDGKPMANGYSSKDFKSIKEALNLEGSYYDGFQMELALNDDQLIDALDKGYIFTRAYKLNAGCGSRCLVKFDDGDKEKFTGDSARFLSEALDNHMAYSTYKMKMAVLYPGDPVVSEKFYVVLGYAYPGDVERALMQLFEEDAGDDL